MIRTLCLGFDGATPQLLFPWIEQGRLPNLASLCSRAAWGPLRSTFPAMTLPAWSSFLTGTEPGVHGIFDFTRREPGSGRLCIVDARDRAVPTIPHLLSERGHRVGTFLFPTTWPPEPLSGGQISGFDSPVATEVPPEACAPPELYALTKRVLGRPLSFAAFSELRKGRDWEERAAAALLRGIEDKERVALALLADSEPYDFFALLFGESDTVSHHFWHLADPLSPRHDPELAPRFADLIGRVYERLDEVLGRLLAADPGFESVIIASDHGFGGSSDRVLHLNAFLAKTGFLSWRHGGHRVSLRGVRDRVARWAPPAALEQAVRLLPNRFVAAADAQVRYGAIDFSGTQVFSDELDYAPSLWLNLEGRDPEGIVPAGGAGAAQRSEIVERLERTLLDWRDPTDGARIVRGLVPRDAVASGPCLDRAPDFYLDLERPGGYSYNLLASRPGGPVTARLPRSGWRGAKGAGMPGSHREDGIYFLAGPGIPPGRRPTEIAAVLPLWLEGQGMSDLLRGEEAGPGPSQQAAEVLASGAGRADLLQRLERLGYLR
ncbi:MAG: alkaline phosphatase family protein [Myxococcota bacterium]|nr:alkaline phosphatase family protein [Myxococcota bacterium]